MSHKGQYVASFAHMIVSGHMTVTNPLFIRLIRLQNSRFFLKILRARSARASHARRACQAREKSVSPQSRSLFSASFQIFCLTGRAYLKRQEIWLKYANMSAKICALIFKDWVEFCLVILWMLLSCIFSMLELE